jgi:hypothetical protein
VFSRLRLGGILFPIELFGVFVCRCLRVIDCRRPDVDGIYGGRAVVKNRAFSVFSVSTLEKSFDACGLGEYFFRWGCSAALRAIV